METLRVMAMSRPERRSRAWILAQLSKTLMHDARPRMGRKRQKTSQCRFESSASHAFGRVVWMASRAPDTRVRSKVHLPEHV